MIIQEAIRQVVEGHDLDRSSAIEVMEQIMTGRCSDAQIGAFLVGLRCKGETTEEITGFASVMRDKAKRIAAPDDCIDTCGTGGDAHQTFNQRTGMAGLQSTEAHHRQQLFKCARLVP